jgi:hypothetical protein
MSKNQAVLETFETRDMTLVTALLCHPDVVLLGTEQCGLDRTGRPLCMFTLGHPTPSHLADLARRHEAEPDGLNVGSRLFDMKKSTMVVPAIQAIRGRQPR